MVTLIRLESSDQGTFGKIITSGLTLFTGELPWRENKSNVSCIPAGRYKCSWTYSPRFRRHMYLVHPVVDRTGIRKHSANLMGSVDKGFKAQLNGCISLGEKLGWIENQKAVLLSVTAMRRFESHMKREPFELEVKYYGMVNPRDN